MNIDDYIKQPIEIKKELLKFFNPKDELIIFDIGACEGEDSIRYSNLFPNSKVFAFEPLPDNYRKIQENIKRYKKTNIFPYKEALSDEVGNATFYVSSGKPDGINQDENWDYGNKSSSLLEPTTKLKQIHNWLKFEDQISVQANTIVNFAKTNNLNYIDFMHIDVQGAELMVLEGAKEYHSKIKIIWLEVENLELYKQQPLKRQIEHYMKQNGFYKLKDTVNKIAGDQLYINRDLLPNNTCMFIKIIDNLRALVRNYFQSPKVSYSQTGEDLIVKFILDSLKIKHPKYLDIGTYHPKNINNTYLFYRNKGKGVCIEADPLLHKKIKSKRRRDICLNVGIGIEDSDSSEFYIMTSKTLNTFSKEEAEKYVSFGNEKIEKIIKVPIVNINDIVEKYFSNELNFVSLDIEGIDEQVIKSFNFNDKRPEVFCIETINYTENNSEAKNEEIINFMKSKNYIVFADTYINTIFVDYEKWKNR